MNGNIFNKIIGLTAGMAIATLAVPSLAQTAPITPELAPLSSDSFLISQDNEEAMPSQAVIEAVLERVLEQSNLEASQLEVVQVQQFTWPNGCLGLGGEDELCTEALVPGWVVALASENQLYIYRTNESGSVVRYDAATSEQYTQQVFSSQTSATRVERTTETTMRQSTSAEANTMTGTQQQMQTGATMSATGTMTSTQQQMQTGASMSATGTMTQMNQQMQASFGDIATNYWANTFISRLAQKNIIKGFPNGRFLPNQPVTRAQFAAMIRQAFETRQVRNSVNFRDVSRNHWAYQAIQEAYQMGFLNPVNGQQFNPNQPMTRLDIIVALARGLNYMSYDGSAQEILSVYNDVSSIPSEYRDIIAAATAQGLIVNYPNVRSLNLNQVASRAEVSALLYQALVSTNQAVAVSSPYIIGVTEVQENNVEFVSDDDDDDDDSRRQNCNQGIGNGAEGCDPGNSQPHGGSNDEGGRTPGNGR